MYINVPHLVSISNLKSYIVFISLVSAYYCSQHFHCRMCCFNHSWLPEYPVARAQFLDSLFHSQQDGTGSRSIPQPSVTYNHPVVASKGPSPSMPLRTRSSFPPSHSPPTPMAGKISSPPQPQPSHLPQEENTFHIQPTVSPWRVSGKSTQPALPTHLSCPVSSVSSQTTSSFSRSSSTESTGLLMSVSSSSFTFLRPPAPSQLCEDEGTARFQNTTSISSASTVQPFVVPYLSFSSMAPLLQSTSTHSSLGRVPSPPSSINQPSPIPSMQMESTGSRSGRLLRFVPSQPAEGQTALVAINISPDRSSPSPPYGSDTPTSHQHSSSSIASFDATTAQSAGDCARHDGADGLQLSPSKKDTLLVPSLPSGSSSSMDRSTSASPPPVSRQLHIEDSSPPLSPPHSSVSRLSSSPPPTLLPEPLVPPPSTLSLWESVFSYINSSLHVQQSEDNFSGLPYRDSCTSSMLEAGHVADAPLKVTLLPPLSFPVLSYNKPCWSLFPKKEVCVRVIVDFNEHNEFV